MLLREIKTIALAKDLYTPFMPNDLNNNKKNTNTNSPRKNKQYV